MRFPFNIARLMRATAFAAVAVWAMMHAWNAIEETGRFSIAIPPLLLCSAALGSAIGALFGKALLGFVGGLLLVYTAVMVSAFMSLVV
ncbi:MAG: hypothetical protein WD845_12425 [Pirellulales bacterium]